MKKTTIALTVLAALTSAASFADEKFATLGDHLPKKPALRPDRFYQFVRIVFFVILFIFVWDFANKHGGMHSKAIAPFQALLYNFDTTSV
jgi:hypothetical protein